MRPLLTFLLLITLLAAVFAPASAAASAAQVSAQSEGPVLSAYPAAGPPGTQVTLIISRVADGVEASALFGELQAQPLESAPDGARLFTITVPAGTAPGETNITAQAGGETLQIAFLVTRQPPLYTTHPGDTPEKVAQLFSVTEKALKLKNLDINQVDVIAPGIKLIIPARLIKGGQGALPSPAVHGRTSVLAIGDGEHWVDVNLPQQRVTVYEGARLVKEFVVSTGTRRHPTLPGVFKVYLRYEQANMAGPGYYLVNVPHILYYDRGYALHGTYWHNNFGVPMSHGCVNLSEADAEWLYGFMPLGGLVMIHD